MKLVFRHFNGYAGIMRYIEFDINPLPVKHDPYEKREEFFFYLKDN